MRVMVFVKANKDTEAGIMPSEQMLNEMGKFNEELVKAGLMLDGDGLRPTSQAVRVKFSGSKRSIVNGPFPEKGIVCGYWIWKVKSMAEAIEWGKRCPNPTGEEGEIELRPYYEISDFGGELTPELLKREERLRKEIEKQKKK